MPQELSQPIIPTGIDWKNYDHDSKLIVLNSITIKNLEKDIPYNELLHATQKLEEFLIQRNIQAGYITGHCGYGGIIEKGSFGHVLEHAIVAIFDNNVAPGEACAGGITTNYTTTDPEIGTLSDIRIAFPPSMSKEKAQVNLKFTLQSMLDQYHATKSIDLAVIIFPH